ncbi:MAG: hypothetical protein C5B53_00060 [Candidatus Melainabacteria bacterium]|nr:MAG: hypothetical protein C5B53_00060 [Candidatus Melainabacteria bacterium]
MRAVIRACVLGVLCFFSIFQLQKSCGEVTDTQWETLLNATGNEDWNQGFDLAAKYLKELKESDDRLPRLRYIFLYTAAGKVSEGKMSYDQLSAITKDLVGKEIVLPYRQIAVAPKPGDLNFICEPKDTKGQLFVAATNKAGTTIHDFEFIKLKNVFKLEGHDAEFASIFGVIDAIKPNPNRSAAIVLRIYISNASVKLRDPT